VDHVKPAELAAYVEHSLGTEDMRRVDAHLVECADCRAELGDGSRAVQQLQTSEAVTRPLLQVSSPSRSLRRPLLIGLLATAAVALVAILPRNRNTADIQAVERDAPPVTRSTLPHIAVVSPEEGTQMRLSQPTLVWRRPDGASEFQVSITDEGGRTVWRTVTSDTVVVPPPDVLQGKQRRYFWYVDALLSDGRSITSGVHGFSVQK
jgi:hypothetical protein